jgi:hypothetical protein
VSQPSPTVDTQHPTEPTRACIESRLATLRSEYAKGEIEVQRVQVRLTELQQVMLRLSGAIVVLEELLASPDNDSSDADHQLTSASPGQAPLSTIREPEAPGQ